jgi:hypothetical protein
MLTNNLGLPQPFVDAATSHHEYKPNRYSVTEVLGGTCEAVLKRRHQGEQDEDVADRVWAIFGTAVHKVLQEAKATDSQLQENWLSVPIKGTKYELSGIFDLYDDETKTVTDWKTCATIKWQKQEFEDYRLQVLIYCWMLRQIGIDAENGEIVMILRDWVKSKARFDKEYPQLQVQKVSWKFTEEDFKEAERHVFDWFANVAEQEKLEDSDLTPCSPKNRWHKDDKWAVVKNGVKRATRVLDDQEKANSLCDELSRKTGKPHHVEYRKGEDVKCEMYCSVSFACPFFQKQV